MVVGQRVAVEVEVEGVVEFYVLEEGRVVELGFGQLQGVQYDVAGYGVQQVFGGFVFGEVVGYGDEEGVEVFGRAVVEYGQVESYYFLVDVVGGQARVEDSQVLVVRYVVLVYYELVREDGVFARAVEDFEVEQQFFEVGVVGYDVVGRRVERLFEFSYAVQRGFVFVVQLVGVEVGVYVDGQGAQVLQDRQYFGEAQRREAVVRQVYFYQVAVAGYVFDGGVGQLVVVGYVELLDFAVDFFYQLFYFVFVRLQDTTGGERKDRG